MSILQKISNADFLEMERELCKRSLPDFIRMAWHVVEPTQKYIHGWHIDAICDHLKAVTAGDINRLLINIPPGPMRDDSIVETSRGPIKLSEITVGDMVLTHKGRYKKVTAVHHQGELPILEIKTNSGRITNAAPSHPYLTPKGWVNAGDLVIGDILAVVNRTEDRNINEKIKSEEARLLGYLVGDGSLTQSMPTFVNADREVIDDFIYCAKSCGFDISESKRKSHWQVRILGGEKTREFFINHGLMFKSSYTKRIPKKIMNSDAETIKNFIGSYWTCDGGFDVRVTRSRGSRFRAYATTVSKDLADDILYCLGMIGIYARIRNKSRKIETASQPGGIYYYFSIEVQQEEMTAKFYNMPGLCSAKNKKIKDCIKKFDNILWPDEIVSITKKESANCMCLTVEDDHSFVCSGIAVKNTMKSLIVGVFWPAWEWGPLGMAWMRYVAASHSQDLSIRDNLRMRRLVSSDWYQKRWPVPLTKDQNEKTNFQNEATGFRQAMAMKSLTGSRGDRVTLDDPHSVEGAISDAERNRTLREFTETVPSRLNNPDKSAIIVVMQRVHEQDISGYILADADKHGYTHLMLPMEYEPGRRCITSVGFQDPRTEDGELLFPGRFPREVVDRDKKLMGATAVAGQFQQRPSPRGGGMIRGEWFKRYRELPRIKYRKIYADTAQKTKERNDYSVFECWGYGHDGNIYLIDLIRGKWEAPELRRRAVDFWNKHQPMTDKTGALRKMEIEDKASGTGLIQDLKNSYKIPIGEIQRSTDKYTRVLDVVGHIESGYVIIPENEPWVSDFLSECESFTADDTHAHDDQIDPMCDAIKDMLMQPNKLDLWIAANR